MITGDSGGQEKGTRKLGGILSILAGIIFFASALAFFLLPPEQLDFTARSEFFESVFANPAVLEFTFWGSMIGAVLAIGVVIVVENHVRYVNGPLVRWCSTLAIIAYAVSAVKNATDLFQIPELAARYVHGDLSTRMAIEAVGPVSVDPRSMLQLLLLGIWFLVVNSLAVHAGALPRPLAYVGMIYGIGSLLTIPFFLLNLQILVLVVMAIGLVAISPIWFIGTGIFLRRVAR